MEKRDTNYVVTGNMGESTKVKDYFKVGVDQTNNTKVCQVWFILSHVRHQLSNNISMLLQWLNIIPMEVLLPLQKFIFVCFINMFQYLFPSFKLCEYIIEYIYIFVETFFADQIFSDIRLDLFGAVNIFNYLLIFFWKQ